VDVGSPIVAHLKPSVTVQPRQSPLPHPDIRELAPVELPSFEKVKDIRFSFPKGSGVLETKALLDCASWELDEVDQGYGTRADTILQHQDSSEP
jgi:hypothetical protein